MRAPPIRSWKAVPAVAPGDSIVGDDPTPPAALSLLLAADNWPIAVGIGLYASPAWPMEANTASLTQRRVAAVIPPACKYSQAWITRSSNDDGQNPVQQVGHTHASATGGGYTGNPVSAADSPVAGAEVYLQTDPVLAMTGVAIVATGTTINDAPTGPIDRALATPELLHASVEVYEFNQVAGASLKFWSRTSDLEGL